MSNKKIVIATIKSWNLNNAIKFKDLNNKKYDVFIIDQKEDLTVEKLDKIKPNYIFFPHWSWIISKQIYENFECIVFHMTDLPYGRGGSPLQNLIINKVYNTKISAIKVGDGIDTGDIYLKEDFYIGSGSAKEIFYKLSDVIFFKMIPYILKNKPISKPQLGKVVSFSRRKPVESNLLKSQMQNLDDLYDFIRMLDGEGYPKAYIKLNNLKIELFGVCIKNGKLEGRFEVSEE